MIGQTISHYKILEKLGGGGMGVVYTAEDTKLHRMVALKFLPPELTRDEEAKQRFIHEAQAASSLQHHNICTIHDIDETEDGQMFICMDSYEGETLKEKITKGPLKIDETINIAIQIAEGLQSAHEHGIIHRDIKPANIFITKDGEVKILDFGLAKLTGRSVITKMGSTVGTIAYMSPEQTRGEDIDVRTDIWSSGVVLYEMITGHLPFKGDYEQAVIYSILNEDPKTIVSIRQDVPPSLQHMVSKTLEKNLNNRYQNMQEFLHDLKTLPSFIGPSNKKEHRQFKLKTVFIPLMLLIAILMAVNLFLHSKKPGSETVPASKWKNSIAVLPFEDMSPQKDQEYFCDGMTEELINRLSNIKELKVPARTSAFFFKGKAQNIQEVGQKLKVNTVLEGSVRRAGNTLRITAQLINIADGYHLWSETYDRQLQDVFALQDEISLAIIHKLKIELLGEVRDRVVKRHTDNTEAYDSYIRGIWLCNNKATEEEWRKAILLFERAIEIDPDFSLAYVGLAFVHLELSLWHFVSTDEALPKAKKALEQALKIDPDLPEALTWSGLIKSRFEYNWPGGETDTKKALELNPNYAFAHLNFTMNLLHDGRIEMALRESLLAVELDPLSGNQQTSYAYLLYLARKYNNALEQCKKMLEFDPEYSYAQATIGLCYVQKLQFPEAIAALQKAVVLSGNQTEVLSYVAYAHAVSGNPGKAHEMLGELDKLSKRIYVSKYYLACIQAALGDKDKAFKSLESAYRERDADLVFLKFDPKFDVLHSDPRFAMILKKIGMDNCSDSRQRNSKDILLDVTANPGIGEFEDAIARLEVLKGISSK
jgi:serine/threonine-protein kinase